MHNFIPFVSTEKDCTYLKKFYPDVERVRVGLDSYNDVKHLQKSKKLWLDTTLDGFCGSQANEHTKPKVTSVIKEAVAEGLLSANSATKDKKPRKLDWIDFIAKFKHSQHLFLPAFLAGPTRRLSRNSSSHS